MLPFLLYSLSFLIAVAFSTVMPDGDDSDQDIPVPPMWNAQTPAPPGFNITRLGLNGSGCPLGSASYTLNSARTAFTITFSEYFASAGPEILPTQNRKNCQVTLTINVPQAYAFAILNVDYRGYYQLDHNVNAYHQAMYYFQGELSQANAASTINGPVSGDNYVYRDSFGATPTVFSPCGRESILNINSAIRVDNSANRAGYGFIANDSVDASIQHVFFLRWATC